MHKHCSIKLLKNILNVYFPNLNYYIYNELKVVKLILTTKLFLKDTWQNIERITCTNIMRLLYFCKSFDVWKVQYNKLNAIYIDVLSKLSYLKILSVNWHILKD